MCTLLPSVCSHTPSLSFKFTHTSRMPNKPGYNNSRSGRPEICIAAKQPRKTRSMIKFSLLFHRVLKRKFTRFGVEMFSKEGIELSHYILAAFV